MTVIRKHHSCGCIVGISVCGNRLGGVGMIRRCGSCDTKTRADYCRMVQMEKEMFPQVSGFIHYLETAEAGWSLSPKRGATELFAFPDAKSR